MFDFHRAILLYHSSFIFRKSRAHVNGNAEAAAHFDGPGLHDTGAEFRHFQHFAVCDLIDFSSIGNDTGIGRVYAVNVGIDFTNISVDSAGNGDGCRIGTASAEGCDVTMTGNALETGNDDDIILFQCLHDTGRLQSQNTALVESIAGLDACLSPRKGDGLLTGFLEGHGHEGDRNLFARRQEHIHFTAVSLRGNLLC